MKKTKTQKQLILLTLVLCLTAIHAQAQDHLWKFDEGTGATSADSVMSSGSVNAALNRATWSSHGSGSAVHLDGTDASYVSFGNSVGQFGTQDFSVALWIQTTDNSISVGDIIGHRTEPSHGNFLSVRMTQDGHVTAEVDQDTSGTNYIGTKSSAGGLNNGQWHYLVITRSGKTLSLYVDGALSSSASGSGVANINNGREFKLGRSLVYSSYSRFSLNASFDDVAISSVALTAAQIASQFGGLNHLWKFDEGSGTISVDSISSSSSFQAVLNNAHWNSYTSGAAVYLDGTDSSYVSFGVSAGQFGTQDFSVALWIQTSDNSISVGDIIGHRTDPSHGNFLSVRMTQDGHVTAEIDQDTSGTNYIPTTSSVGGLNNGQWHYLVITRSGKTLSLYVDGVLSANATGSGVANINNGRHLKLGRSLIYASYSRFALSASFDDVAIYSVALTLTQIASQYQAGTSFNSGTTRTTSPPASGNAQSCWLDSYGRGVGMPLSSCPDGQEKNGALCYPTCSSGYTGNGPVCWQNCPSGFTDTGADCLKPAAYGRGAGYALWDGDKCNNENPQGCEQYGALYYPKCATGYYAFGCCICSPTCVSGMTDIGVSCQKNSYGRGAGTPLICASNEEEDAALCYTQCKAGYDGVGPVCWGGCPESLYQCGALCLESAEECTEKLLDIGLKAAEGVLEIALDIENPVGVAISAAKTIIDIAPDLTYPVCSS